MKFVEVDKVDKFPYKGEVHDIEVEQDACYTANGYVVHNSAAGSLVNYLLEITDVNPLKHDLMFERFLDIARADVVDIDCLHELTAIKLASGEIKCLNDVKIGDVILDHMNNPQKVLNWTTRTAKIGYEKIVEIVVKNGKELGSFVCPGHHRMINNKDEIKFVYELNIGDKIKSFDSNEDSTIISINSIDIDYNKIRLVDIQVENTETFQIFPFKVNNNLTCIQNLYPSQNL